MAKGLAAAVLLALVAAVPGLAAEPASKPAEKTEEERMRDPMYRAAKAGEIHVGMKRELVDLAMGVRGLTLSGTASEDTKAGRTEVLYVNIKEGGFDPREIHLRNGVVSKIVR